MFLFLLQFNCLKNALLLTRVTSDALFIYTHSLGYEWKCIFSDFETSHHAEKLYKLGYDSAMILQASRNSAEPFLAFLS